MSNVETPYDPAEIIQLMEGAVEGRTPPWANEDDMYEALEHCGIRCDDLFFELEQLTGGVRVSPEQAAELIQQILFRRYDSEMLKASAHKVPVH